MGVLFFQPFGEQSSDVGVSAERRAGGHESGEEQTAGTVTGHLGVINVQKHHWQETVWIGV